MISVIVAVHNQLPMNRLFVQQLKDATRNPFELIVIDNASTDGSADFFESAGATVIRNAGNNSYPRSQNQGIALARHDWLAFLNNDVIVSPGWDKVLIESMTANKLDVATSCGVERLETPAATHRLERRWKLIRGMVSLLGTGESHLRWMHRLMYPHWRAFCAERQVDFQQQVLKGFAGNTVMIRRAALEKIGLWDERVQAADFDLYLRTAIRARDVGDIKPMHIALDCFVHHYIRLTIKGGYPPFADRDNLIALEDKWSAADLALLKDATD
jgi:GT2 family glycosyltransferase